MNISLQKPDNSVGLISLEIEPSDYAAAIDKSLKNAQRKAQVPGFRPGMVPMGLVKKLYAESALLEQINEITHKQLTEFLKDENLDILFGPIPHKEKEYDGDFKNPGKFVFYFDVAFRPEFNLTLDKGLKFTQRVISISDKVLTDELDRLANRYGTVEAVSNATNDNDHIECEVYEVTEDGTKSDGGYFLKTLFTLEDVSNTELRNKISALGIDGVLQFNPLSLNEDNTILGRIFKIKADELNTLPKNLEMKIEKIDAIQKAEFNADFFSAHYPAGEVNSVEELKESIRKEITAYYEGYAEKMFIVEVQKQLVENTQIVLPLDLLRKYLLLTEKNLSEEKLNIDFHRYVNGFKWELIENKLIKDFEIIITKDELETEARSEIRHRFRQYGLANVDDEMITQVLNSERKDEKATKQQVDRILTMKIADVIKKNCTIDITEIPEDQFFK